jgi:uncharacterized protein involved in outer membrane biogenesis
MNKLIKRLLKIVGGLVLVLVVLLIVAILFLDSIVKQSINTGAPKLLGVKTHIESVSIRPFRGIVHLKELTLANPDGYTDKYPLFAVKELYVELNMRSLFTDTIMIHKILVNAPACTYETRQGLSNIDALQKQISKREPAEQPKKTEAETPAKPKAEKAGKKVIIDEIQINDTRLAYSSPVTAGTFIPLPIPSITIKDIGKGKDGESISDALNIIFNGILKGVGSAVSGAGDLMGSAAKGAADLLGSTAQGATDATKASTEALDAGVKETSKAVGSALDEVGGLFKSKKK